MWKPVFDDVTEENIAHAIQQGDEIYDTRYRIRFIKAYSNQVWIVAEHGRGNKAEKISKIFDKSKSEILNGMTDNEINDLEVFGLGFVLSNKKTNTKIDGNEVIADLLSFDDEQSVVNLDKSDNQDLSPLNCIFRDATNSLLLDLHKASVRTLIGKGTVVNIPATDVFWKLYGNDKYASWGTITGNLKHVAPNKDSILQKK